jgi:hypothetical protein|tara:strand:- start:1231 stop:1506 length:276 start_codon:yes stop_codon:yes gene_type:complete
VAKKEQSTNPLLNSLNILASKLTEKEYRNVTQSMFRLYMGDKLGYKETFDPQFMADISAVWQFKKEKKVEKKAKLYKLKVVKGGKDAGKSL